MSKVHILKPEIISKIAAGEVIERPASVVKELLENSLDAGATNIEITLDQAGKKLIQIRDNGSGVEKDDLNTIFERHSTSKIDNIDDLENILSLGFRGEALYSIAAISDIILRSKTKDQAEGWEVHMRGGEKLDLKPCSCPNGTEIEIRELFFNTPARRKFLKSNTTELNQILNIVIPHSLTHPNCRFKLTHQNKTTLDLNKTSTEIQRIAQTLKLDEEHIIQTEYDLDEKDISIKMYLGDMNIRRSYRDMQFIFVNGRPVQSKSIGFHMNQIYQLVFPPKTYPFFCLYITIPPAEVDVNIHPTKREVKIKGEQALCSVLRSMCEDALMSSGKVQQVADEKWDEEKTIERALTSSNPSSATFDASTQTGFDTSSLDSVKSTSDHYAFPQGEEQPVLFEHAKSQDKGNLQEKLARAQYIGPFINKFLIFSSGKSLLVVDQHAAQERIVFEQLMSQMEEDKVEVQHLLSPISIKLSIQEMNAWEEVKDELEKIGLATTLFGDGTIAVNTYPVLLKDPEGAIHHLLAGESMLHCDHATIARRACRSSVMAGDTMNPDQAQYQRDQLIRCRDPYTCPHGRPTVIEMTESFLDKQFLRT